MLPTRSPSPSVTRSRRPSCAPPSAENVRSGAYAGPMIARLRGKPVANTPEGLVLDVGGVGYLVHATPTAVRKGGSADETTVETYLHVREDALQLYGFADRSERELFVQLLAVSGIGPTSSAARPASRSSSRSRSKPQRDAAMRSTTCCWWGRRGSVRRASRTSSARSSVSASARLPGPRSNARTSPRS